MRGENLTKFLKAIDLIAQHNGATIAEISRELEIHRRSVYRLIQRIEDFGFPLYNDRFPLEKEKRWKIDASYLKKLPNMTVPDVQLNISEIIALHLLKSEGYVLKGTELEKHIQSVFGKLAMILPEKAAASLTKIKKLFVSSDKFGKNYAGLEPIIEQLLDAALEQITCRITYHAFHDDRVKRFSIDPLHFFENDGGLYVLVRLTGSDDIRTIAVERIQEIRETGDAFDYPAGFDPEALLASAFNLTFDDPVQARIWFAPHQARYIKARQWAKRQNFTEQEDGSIILDMETSGLWEVKQWVLSFGKAARVLAPEALKNEIRDELIAAARQYDDEITPSETL